MPETNRPADLATQSLRIHLLAGFRVFAGSRLVGDDAWRLRKAASLIKLLALSPTHCMHREQILDILWPDLDPKAATNNLHYALHVARRALDAGTHSPHLRLRSDLLTLAPPDLLWVDLEAFERGAAEARHTRDPATYRSALALYAGELLPEDLYEDWVANRREETRSLHLALLLELANLEEQSEQPGRAIEMLQRAITSDPVCEEAHAGLMRLYARCGQRHQALRQYEQLRHALQEELDAEPDDASRQLYEQILAGTLPGRVGESAGITSLRRHNLPAALTSFIGRERETEELKRLLGRARLLTVIGTGGAGKTRLALHLAHAVVDRYRDGIWLVELASLADPARVAEAVAAVLEITEQAGQSPMATVADSLKSKQLLLVLDNCEHLVEACAELVEVVLHSCPEAQILATSREALGIDGEVTATVMPFSVPDFVQSTSPAKLLGYDAVRLFVDRAQRRRASFLLTEQNAPAVVEICRRVEGIPLAIELAAARIGVLSVEELAARLVNALGSLTAGRRTAAARQQTLRDTLDWSYDLLDESERALFNRLAVFGGGWTLEAAEVIGSADADVLDLLSRLVDKSLVIAEAATDNDVRYRLLEPVRQYAESRLKESAEAKEVQRQHAALYLALAEQAYAEMRGLKQVTWLQRLEAERDNWRAALNWSQREGETGVGLQLAGALWRFWYLRGYGREGLEWLQTMLSGHGDTDSPTRARALEGAGAMAHSQRKYDQAASGFEQALQIHRATGDRQKVALCLANLGTVAQDRGDIQTSRALKQEGLALSREMGDEYGIRLSLLNLASLLHQQGDHEQARPLYQEALALSRDHGDLEHLVIALNNLGELERDQGNMRQAAPLFLEALAMSRDLGYREVTASCLEGLASGAFAQGQAERAACLYGAALALREALGSSTHANAVAEYEQRVGSVRTALDDGTFSVAWEKGREMSLDQAVEFAQTPEESVSIRDKPSTAPVMDGHQTRLTRRERELAALLARGLTNRQIAAEFHIAERTVDTHVSHILSKLGLTSRKQISTIMDAYEEPI